MLSRSVRRYTDLISLFGAELGTAVHPPADPPLPLMSVLPRAVPDTTQAGLMCDPPQKVALQRSITDVTCSDISLLHIGQLCLLGACCLGVHDRYQHGVIGAYHVIAILP